MQIMAQLNEAFISNARGAILASFIVGNTVPPFARCSSDEIHVQKAAVEFVPGLHENGVTFHLSSLHED